MSLNVNLYSFKLAIKITSRYYAIKKASFIARKPSSGIFQWILLPWAPSPWICGTIVLRSMTLTPTQEQILWFCPHTWLQFSPLKARTPIWDYFFRLEGSDRFDLQVWKVLLQAMTLLLPGPFRKMLGTLKVLLPHLQDKIQLHDRNRRRSKRLLFPLVDLLSLHPLLHLTSTTLAQKLGVGIQRP